MSRPSALPHPTWEPQLPESSAAVRGCHAKDPEASEPPIDIPQVSVAGETMLHFSPVGQKGPVGQRAGLRASEAGRSQSQPRLEGLQQAMWGWGSVTYEAVGVGGQSPARLSGLGPVTCEAVGAGASHLRGCRGWGQSPARLSGLGPVTREAVGAGASHL
ncbi:hypothetical protein NDU88_008794 [Pleurodeles waltl]|uniref:Uncharacterized protein n=1 Tax=Pleurodeles waltl TaxID=8319 RepID=A0AAV7NF90_PLEWA|nr:hypothetical protein NDU88_008794 [Pleurodeles waltl]